MDKTQYAQLDQMQRKMVAVAYLMSNPEFQPEGSQTLFNKLGYYDNRAKAITEEMKSAREFIRQSNIKLQQSVGSINAVSGIIAETLDPASIENWCMAYEMKGEEQIPQPGKAEQKSTDVDMAGSTAKTLPPVELKK